MIYSQEIAGRAYFAQIEFIIQIITISFPSKDCHIPREIGYTIELLIDSTRKIDFVLGAPPKIDEFQLLGGREEIGILHLENILGNPVVYIMVSILKNIINGNSSRASIEMYLGQKRNPVMFLLGHFASVIQHQ